MNKKLTKKELNQIAHTLDYVKNNCPEKLNEYTQSVFNLLYVEGAKSGISKSEKKAVVATAGFLKEQTENAVKVVTETQNNEDIAKAQKVALAYRTYIKYFVNQALGLEQDQQF